MPDRLTRLYALLRLNVILVLREPGALVSRLAMPVVLMVLLRPLYIATSDGRDPVDGTAQAVTGMSVMFSVLALALVGSGILRERAWHTWDRLRASGATPLEMFVGKAVPALTFLVVQQVIVLSVGIVGLGLVVHDAALLAVVLLVWVSTLVCIGMALGAFARNLGELSAVQDVGGIALTGLGGALVPLAVLPAWVHYIAVFSPGYWGVESMRWALTGNIEGVLHAEAILAGFAAVAVAAAVWRVRRGWPRAQVI
jgi:ABC-2 type transport system permease protein